MKKIILSAAIAAICAAPAAAIAADNNLYGQLRYSFNSVDDKTSADPTKHKDGLSGEDNISIFGLKGSAGDDKLTAFYHLQTGAPSDGNGGQAFDQRFYFGGLKGGFGKVAYGRMTNAYKMPGFKLDPYYNLSHVGVGGSVAKGGASYGLSPATNGFTDNALQYVTPSFSGIKVNAGVYVDDSNEDDHGTNVGAVWSNKAINVGVQYASNAKTAATVPGLTADGDAIRVHGGFKADKFSVGLSYEMVDDAGTTAGTTSSADYMYLFGRFNVTNKTELVATVGTVSPDDDSAVKGAEGTGFQLGVFQTVVPKTQMYVTYGAADLDNNDEDPSVISIGAIHKFGFGG